MPAARPSGGVARPVMPAPVRPPMPLTPPVPVAAVPPAPAAAKPAVPPAPPATPKLTPSPLSPLSPQRLSQPMRPSTGEIASVTQPRKPINPFLSNDPNLKARRLARALVSDMIAYLPDKREQGLRDGTLKALFKEEIKKSYEEYVDQIGREFADSTTHFQEALNDLLAGGQKMF